MESKIRRLRERIEGMRVGASGSAADELDMALEELQAVWQELEHQADVLAAEQLRHTRIFHHAPFACLITDLYGSVRDANRAALELLGVPAPFLVRKPLATFVADSMKEAFRRRLARMSTERHEAWEPVVVDMRLAGGREIAVELGARPLPMPDGRSDLIWYLRGGL
jgi:PAS domain S-box-containing protein